MNVNLVLTAVCLCWASISCLAQDSYSKEYRNALRYGAKVKITVAVSDSNASPVSNATVNVFFEQKDGNQYKVDGKTDPLGMHVVEGMTRSSVGGSVRKEGYYRSVFRLPYATGQERIDGDRWLPWNPTIPVVLREIRNPIPMYVKWVDWVEIPVDTDVGFDCVIGDLVKPLGGGGHPDILLRISTENAGGRPKRLTLKSGEDDAGFAVKDVHASSAFKSDHFAPMDGYSSQVEAQMLPLIGGGEMVDSLLGKTSYLAFRSRISHGEDGSVTQANYGKIYGPLKFGHSEKPEVAVVRFLYYFNPTPNDRNIEFDGKNNLFKPGWNSKLNWSREP